MTAALGMMICQALEVAMASDCSAGLETEIGNLVLATWQDLMELQG